MKIGVKATKRLNKGTRLICTASKGLKDGGTSLSCKPSKKRRASSSSAAIQARSCFKHAAQACAGKKGFKQCLRLNVDRCDRGPVYPKGKKGRGFRAPRGYKKSEGI